MLRSRHAMLRNDFTYEKRRKLGQNMGHGNGIIVTITAVIVFLAVITMLSAISL